MSKTRSKLIEKKHDRQKKSLVNGAIDKPKYKYTLWHYHPFLLEKALIYYS